MSNHTWSYSSISTFAQCKKRWMGERLMGFRSPPTPALEFGSAAHRAAEEYGKEGTPFPEEFEFMEAFVEPLRSAPGTKLYEYEMGLTAELDPCEFRGDDKCWWRGIADYLCISEDEKTCHLVDYKTGSKRYSDTKQLNILSLAIFAHFPKVETVNGALIFVKNKPNDALVTEVYQRKDSEKMWEYWDGLIETLQHALITGEPAFTPTKNALCKNYCPVTICKFNGSYTGG